MCQDIGFLNPLLADGRPDYSSIIRCQCRTEQDAADRQQRYMKYCQLPQNTEHLTFETFQTKKRADLKKAYDLALRLANEDSAIKWLTLIGNVDTGKTHLAIAICRRWLARGKAARYSFVPSLLRELKKGFELDGEQSYQAKFNMFCHVPLLVLDDLGVENPSVWAREQLQMLVHERGINALPLVVTTNLPLDELRGDDEHRIASRLRRERFCHIVEIGLGME